MTERFQQNMGQRGLGCFLLPGLLGAGCLFLGLYNLFGRETLSGGEMLLAVLMVGLGMLVLLPVVIGILFVLWMRRLRRNLMAGMESIARNMEYMATQGRSGGTPPGPGDVRTYEPLEVQAEVKDPPPEERKELGDGKRENEQ